MPGPFEAYKGNDPYIFVSYAHDDMNEVYQDLAALHQLGYRIWYDEGIPLSQQFPDRIQEAIKKCSFFMAFLSPHAVDSQWVRDEIFFALEEQKQFLAIHLRETALEHGLAVRIGFRQAAVKYKVPREDYLGQLKRDLPASLIEVPVTPPRPKEDFAREIDRIIAAGAGPPRENLLELAGLLGVSQETAEQIIDATDERLGIFRKNEATFRQLVQRLIKIGPLERGHPTLVNRANALGILPERWEAIVQDEALLQAKELSQHGQMAEARDILVSCVGKVLPQSAQIREFLEELQQRMNSQRKVAWELPPRPQAPEAAAATAVQPPAIDRAVTPLGERVAITWVRIPAGLFIRGCPPEFIRHIKEDFRAGTDVLETYPVRKEPLEEFWISLTPVTNAQFYPFVKAAGHRFPAGWRGTMPPYPPDAPDKPVTGVTWQDSASFAEWLGARLPARAEYEKACRGENGLLFPWGNHFDPSKCNTAESERGLVLPVGAIPEGASPYGVLDLVGNVWQWADDDGERQTKMTVGASYEFTGEIYGAGFFDMSRPPESSEKDLGFRVACSDVRKLRFESQGAEQ